ncbi:MAG: hypothetical protein Q8920_16440, partial [Bacillota bacterium]|nr:hypothetical protein [Bacillota bacterium]
LSCGIDMLDVFKRDLQERKAEGIDAQNAYMFRTYYNEALKTIARSRKRFGVFINELSGLFPDDFITGTSQLLADSSRYWDISANISLKLAITKSLTLVDNLCEQLMLVKETEKRIAEKLDQNIIQYI